METSPEAVSSLRSAVKNYRPHQRILRQGQTPELFGSLRSGWAYAYRVLDDGRRHLQGIMLPGETIALDSLFIGSNTISFGINALTSAAVCWFPIEAMACLLHKNKTQRSETELWLSYYFWSLNHRAANISRNDATGRFAEFVVEILTRLRLRNLVRGEGYEFPPTQAQIADCLGLTPVYVGRILADLRQRRILEVSDRTLYILDERRLMAIARWEGPSLDQITRRLSRTFENS